jgi:hypothetical protein
MNLPLRGVMSSASGDDAMWEGLTTLVAGVDNSTQSC